MTRIVKVDRDRFGPWAIVTGASAGIGREFARQLAASGLNLVLVARRLEALERIGHDLAGEYGVEYRPVGLDLSHEGFIDRLDRSTADLDIGLVVSNAGAIQIAELLDHDREHLHRMVRLNAVAHLDLAHHFGRRLSDRRRGGLLLVSSVGGRQGMPGSAEYGASKAFTLVLGEGLHVELARLGVNVTVLLPGATATEMVQAYGMDVQTMNRMMRPLRMMPVERVVADGLEAVGANRPTHIAGRTNRVLASVFPRRFFTGMTASMSARVRARLAGIEGTP